MKTSQHPDMKELGGDPIPYRIGDVVIVKAMTQMPPRHRRWPTASEEACPCEACARKRIEKGRAIGAKIVAGTQFKKEPEVIPREMLHAMALARNAAETPRQAKEIRCGCGAYTNACGLERPIYGIQHRLRGERCSRVADGSPLPLACEQLAHPFPLP